MFRFKTLICCVELKKKKAFHAFNSRWNETTNIRRLSASGNAAGEVKESHLDGWVWEREGRDTFLYGRWLQEKVKTLWEMWHLISKIQNRGLQVCRRENVKQGLRQNHMREWSMKWSDGRKNKMGSRVKRRGEGDLILEEKRRLMEETRTSNCTYAQSQDRWRKDENLRWFLNQCVCVCVLGKPQLEPTCSVQQVHAVTV